MGRILPGNSEQGGYSGGSIGRIKVATHSGDPLWRLLSANQNGGPFGWVNLVTQEGGAILRIFFSGLLKRKARVFIQEKQSSRKKVNVHLLFCTVDL